MKTETTILLLTFFLLVGNIYSRTDKDPDKLGRFVIISKVAPLQLPSSANTKGLKSDVSENNPSLQVDHGFSSNTKTLSTAIDNLVADRGTTIQYGFYATKLLTTESTTYKKVVLVLSGGDPTYSYLSAITAPHFKIFFPQIN